MYINLILNLSLFNAGCVYSNDKNKGKATAMKILVTFAKYI